MRAIPFSLIARALALAGLAGVLLTSCVTPQGQRIKAVDHYKLGMALLAATGPVEAGETELNKAIQADPLYAPPHNARGQLWARTAKHSRDEIVEEYETAVRLDPNLAEAHHNLGQVFLYEPANILSSVEHLKTAVRLNPKYASAWGFLAEALRASQDWEGAVAAAREASALDPHNAYALFRLASALTDRPGHSDEAISLLTYALTLATDHINEVIIRTNLGLLLVDKSNRGAEGLKHLETVVSMEPKISINWSNLGRAQFQLGDPDAALKSANQAIQLDPNGFSGYKLRGDLYLAKQDLDAALPELQKVLELYPSYGEVIMQVGWIRHQKGDPEGAIADYTKVITMAPDYAAGYAYRAMSLGQIAKYEDAMKDVTRALELDPNSAWLWTMRGALKRNLGQVAESVQDLTRAIELQPTDFALWLNRADSRRTLGDYEAALADTSEAIRLKPDAAAFHLIRGKIYEDKGDVEAALVDLTQATEMEPNNPMFVRTRGEIKYRKGDFAGALEDYHTAMATAVMPHKAYTGFWCALLRIRLHQPADPQDLQSGREAPAGWTSKVAAFLDGSLDEAGFFASAIAVDSRATTEQQCEAYYYAGMIRLLAKHDFTGARELFEKCGATKVLVFSEYRFAQIELARTAAPVTP